MCVAGEETVFIGPRFAAPTPQARVEERHVDLAKQVLAQHPDRRAWAVQAAHGSSLEGRRNFVENHEYTHPDGSKRVRIKFNMESKLGHAHHIVREIGSHHVPCFQKRKMTGTARKRELSEPQ